MENNDRHRQDVRLDADNGIRFSALLSRYMSNSAAFLSLSVYRPDQVSK